MTPLPRRVPGMFPAPRRMRALDDVGTLRRVLDGLRGLDDGLARARLTVTWAVPTAAGRVAATWPDRAD